MKALTLQQPYATLGALGLKAWETRSKPTKFRGWHLITSSLSRKPEYMALAEKEIYHKDIWPQLKVGNLVFGAIIGKAELTQCVTTLGAIEIMRNRVSDGLLDKAQMEMYIAYGDFSPGRWAYRWNDSCFFDEPIPCKGNLGFWETKQARGSYEIVPYLRATVPGSYFQLNYLGQPCGCYAENKTTLLNCMENIIMSESDSVISDIEKRLFKL